MKAKVLVIGLDANCSPEAYASLKAALEVDFPEHKIVLIAGLRYAAEFTPVTPAVKTTARLAAAYL